MTYFCDGPKVLHIAFVYITSIKINILDILNLHFYFFLTETLEMLLGSISTDKKLVIDQIIGTSAKSPSNFVVQDNLVAYIASGGVVVSTIDASTKSITSQRFFCANKSSFAGQPGDFSPSSANAYLNMAYGEPHLNQESDKKDRYGFPIAVENEIVYGNITTQLESNENTSPSKLKDRVRSINCLAISPNKRVLAVGEIGYSPRILLFSLASDLSNNPVASIHEHSFGINAIAFSPDLRYFCSLGTTNDGFLNVWKYSTSAISLHATNKCSSVINQLIWHENLVITLGLRIIKVWLFEQDEQETAIKTKTAAIKGKNVLLGSIMNSNFIGGCALNNDEFLIHTNSQQLVLLKLNYDALKLIHLESPKFEFSNILVDYELGKLWFSSQTSNICSIDIGDLQPSSDTPSTPRQLSRSNTSLLDEACTVLKWANFDKENLIYLSSKEKIVLLDKTEREERTLVESVLNNISGVKTTYQKNVIAFSHDGTIKEVLESENTTINDVLKFELICNDVIQNSLTAVDSRDLKKSLILGDSYGQIYVIERNEAGSDKLYDIIYRTKAHSSSVTEIVYFETDEYEFFSSISRDRMIQIFYRLKTEELSQWDILQTFPTHTGNLLKLHYHNSRIYVCSTDRTISIHKIEFIDGQILVIQEKIITLKNSPISMKFFGDSLVVSTNDKNLLIYNNDDGFDFQRSIKLYNDKTNESLLIENFVVHGNILIISSSDKSIRAFNFNSGKPLSVCWGHLDSILHLFMNDDKDQVYSIGSDGCLFKWNLVLLTETASTPFDHKVDLPIDQETLPLYTKVTRKIISSNLAATSPRRKKSIQEDISVSPIDSEINRSPSPRLSNATMKRMEARKKLEPVPAIPPTPKIEHEPKEFSRPIVPVSRPSSPVRQRSSPVKSSPTKSPTRLAAKSVASPTRTISKRTLMTFHDGGPIRATYQDDFMEKSIAYLAIIKSRLPKATITAQEKQKLRTEVEELVGLLNDDPDAIELDLINDKENEVLQQFKGMNLNERKLTSPKGNDQLLERYSDKLVEMVGQKLDALMNK